MTATLSYNRPKLAGTVSTGLATTLMLRERDADNVYENPPTAGDTAILDTKWRMDADESGGADVQDVCRVSVVPTVNVATGAMQWAIAVTPVLGDGTDGATQVFTVTHPQVADAWQTAAGRARQ